MVSLLHVMLGGRLGGLERVFLDYQAALASYAVEHNGQCRAVLKANGATAKLAGRELGSTVIPVWSDWDPLTRAIAKIRLGKDRVSAALCHGQRAYRIMARLSAPPTKLVACIHKPSFDVDLKRTHYICVANHLADLVRSKGIPPHRIHVLHNTVSVPTHSAKPFAHEGPAHIVAAGRLHPKKGFDLLLRALARLAARKIAFRATIAGDGEEGPRLKELTRELGLQDRVTFSGWSNDLSGLLTSADVFVFPSRQEGFPLMLLEAMGAGVPVVATSIKGTDEIIIDDRNGRLVPPEDIEQLTDRIAGYIESPQSAIRNASAGRAHVLANHARGSLSKRLHEIMDDILGDAVNVSPQ
jgi:glycosyltransferase involved in cell wall biosynthesis